MKCYYSIIPPFHYSWLNMQNDCLGISYCQRFVEIPLHLIKSEEKKEKWLNPPPGFCEFVV